MSGLFDQIGLSLGPLSAAWPSVPAAMVLGCACGVVGCLAVLRQRALMADTLAHAALPGVAMAFLVASWIGIDGRTLPVLLLGATVSGIMGIVLAHLLQRYGRLKDDAAMAAVLGSMFGLGAVLLSVVQRSPAGGQAGLAKFLFGQTAAMQSADAMLISITAGLCMFTAAVLYKELRLLCFDPSFCAAIGRRPGVLDAVLLAMLTLVTVVGLQAVGLVLVVAMLIIPAVAARFWTDKLWVMMLIGGGIGASAAGAGGLASATVARFPAGPAIVLAAGVLLTFSAMVAPRKGVLARWGRSRNLTLTARREHALRTCLEAEELGGPLPRVAAGALVRAKLATAFGEVVTLTAEGRLLAEQITRRHRLWEAYLITFGSQAPEHVDDQADLVEHLRDPVLIAELEATVQRQAGKRQAVMPSPHAIVPGRQGMDRRLRQGPEGGRA